MKKNVRKALAISGMAIAIGTSGFIFDASAKEGVQRSHQERILKARNINGSEKIALSRGFSVGIVTTVSSDSVTISHKSKNFTAKITSDTRILNRSWKKLPISDIKEGDRIKVFGTISDGIINAKTIRRISIK